MRKIGWIIEVGLVSCLMSLFAVLPFRVSLSLGEFLGTLCSIPFKRRRSIALDNIKGTIDRGHLRIDSTPEDIVARHFANLGRSFAEISRVLLKKDRRVIENITFEGIEDYINARQRGKGVIFITGHCGNWELMAIAMAWKGYPVSVIARPLDNPYMDRVIGALRTRFGNKVISKWGALRGSLRALRAGETIGILIDQSVVPDEGVIIEFLGKKAYTTKMPALIAMKTGAAVIPAFINYLGDGRHKFSVGKEIGLQDTGNNEQDIIENTRRFSAYIEDYIRQTPSEWLWMHRRWKPIRQ